MRNARNIEKPILTIENETKMYYLFNMNSFHSKTRQRKTQINELNESFKHDFFSGYGRLTCIFVNILNFCVNGLLKTLV